VISHELVCQWDEESTVGDSEEGATSPSPSSKPDQRVSGQSSRSQLPQWTENIKVLGQGNGSGHLDGAPVIESSWSHSAVIARLFPPMDSFVWEVQLPERQRDRE
jgi:hypothetical protein